MSKSVGQSKFGTEQEIRAEQTTGPDLGQDDAVTPDLGQASAAKSDPGRADGALEPGCLTGEKACYYARLRQAGCCAGPTWVVCLGLESRAAEDWWRPKADEGRDARSRRNLVARAGAQTDDAHGRIRRHD
jgi:hypothetical protein